ncbi:hypothetical protein [Nocardia cyriacigeorgica]|nr:hypothetical protein [Nocardia cyriacigeorgica]
MRNMRGDKDISPGQLTERLGFTPARQRTPVGDLSGVRWAKWGAR